MNARNEFGSAHTSISPTAASRIWTGSNNDGTKHASQFLGPPSGRDHARNGFLGNITPTLRIPLNSGSDRSVNQYRFYGLSPVIKLIDEVAVQGVSIESSPTNATSGYVAGETIRVRLDFGEAVTATGSPYLVLDVGGQARRAAYESGSGTRHLVFAYGVARGDTDANGVSLCSDTMMDANCGRIALDGGSIVAQSDSLAAELDLPELGNQGRHKVHAAAPRARGLTTPRPRRTPRRATGRARPSGYGSTSSRP